MSSHADSTVTIQTFAESVLSSPSWLGEVVLLARYLKQQGALEALNERVRFARRHFGRFEVIDFVAVLFGYAERRRTDPGCLLRTAAALG